MKEKMPCPRLQRSCRDHAETLGISLIAEVRAILQELLGDWAGTSEYAEC